MPSAGVTSVVFSGLELPAFVMTTKVWVNNPNGWPMSGSIMKANATITSLDKDDPNGNALYVGPALLPNPVNIGTSSNTTFDIVAQGDLHNALLLARLTKDCLTAKAPRTTKVGVNLTSAVVDIFKTQLDLSDIGAYFEAIVPCPSLSRAHSSEVEATVSQTDSINQQLFIV